MPSPFRVVPCWVKARNLPRHALRTPLAGSCEKSRTLTSQTLRFAAGMTGRRSCSQPGGSVRAVSRIMLRSPFTPAARA